MKLFATFAGIVAAAVLCSMAGCNAPPTVPQEPVKSNITRVESFRGDFVTKYYDADDGVICYVYATYGISCVKK